MAVSLLQTVKSAVLVSMMSCHHNILLALIIYTLSNPNHPDPLFCNTHLSPFQSTIDKALW